MFYARLLDTNGNDDDDNNNDIVNNSLIKLISYDLESHEIRFMVFIPFWPIQLYSECVVI